MTAIWPTSPPNWARPTSTVSWPPSGTDRSAPAPSCSACSRWFDPKSRKRTRICWHRPVPAGEALPGRGIIVEGMDDMLVRIARCCAPVPGDPIVGFITIGRGVSVHRSDCTNINSLSDQRERMVEVSWPPDRVGTFAVWVQVEALDRTRLLRDVTAAISDLGGNITASSSVTGRDRVAILRYEVELSDPGTVPRLIADLRGVDGVFAAYRLVTEPTGQ